MTQGSYICGRCNPPRPLSHRPLPDRRHSTRRPGRRRARSRCSSLRQFYQTHSERNWQEGSASLAFPARSSRRSSIAILRSRRSRRGWAPLSGSNGFYKRRPAGQRLRLARGGIHRLAGEPWHDYPNRRGDRRHWNRRDRRQRRSVRAHGYPGGHGIAVFTEVKCAARPGNLRIGRGLSTSLLWVLRRTGLLDYRAFRCRWPAALLLEVKNMGCPISSRKRAILWSVSRWLAEVTRSMQLSPPVSFSTDCSIGAERYRAGTENLVPYMPAERGNERPVIWEVRAAGTRPERRFTEGQLILQAQADPLPTRWTGPAVR